MHIVGMVTTLVAQIEIVKKLENLSQPMNMVHNPALVCLGYGANHFTSSCPLESTYTCQPLDVSYVQKY